MADLKDTTIDGDLEVSGSIIRPNQKVLWSGAIFMSQNQSITLPESISSQENGIILVFSGYSTSTWEAKDYNWNSHFISKKEIELLPNSEHIFFMGGTEGLSAFKYINIQNGFLGGHKINDSSIDNDYGKFVNTNFVLRYVLGI